jgi:hypothetical protein
MMNLVNIFGLYLRQMAFVLLMKLNKGLASPKKKREQKNTTTNFTDQPKWLG